MRIWAEIHDHSTFNTDGVVKVCSDGRTLQRATYVKGDISDAESVVEALGYHFRGRPSQVVPGILTVPLEQV